MTDDIVTELRRDSVPDCLCSWCVTHDRAANEIERLREFVLSFPCTCWINKPKCVVCQVKEGK